MLPTGYISIAIMLRLLAGAGYITAVLRGRARPNLISWFFWGFTALVAFGVQIHQGEGAQALITLTIGLGPMIVFALALVKNAHHTSFTLTDKGCTILTICGIALWVCTKNPLLALLASISVDFISGVPTIIKCCRQPHTEHIAPYFLSASSMIVALLTIHRWQLTSWLFPAYILATNLNFVLCISLGTIARLQRQTAAVVASK